MHMYGISSDLPHSRVGEVNGQEEGHDDVFKDVRQ